MKVLGSAGVYRCLLLTRLFSCRNATKRSINFYVGAYHRGSFLSILLYALVRLGLLNAIGSIDFFKVSALDGVCPEVLVDAWNWIFAASPGVSHWSCQI